MKMKPFLALLLPLTLVSCSNPTNASSSASLSSSSEITSSSESLSDWEEISEASFNELGQTKSAAYDELMSYYAVYTEIRMVGSDSVTSVGQSSSVDIDIIYSFDEEEFFYHSDDPDSLQEGRTLSYVNYTASVYIALSQVMLPTSSTMKYYANASGMLKAEGTTVTSYDMGGVVSTAETEQLYIFNERGVISYLYSDSLTTLGNGSASMQYHTHTEISFAYVLNDAPIPEHEGDDDDEIIEDDDFSLEE